MAFNKYFLISILLPIILCKYCKDGYFSHLKVNQETSFLVGPETEACYMFPLNGTKEKIVLVFPRKNLSYSAEIIIYKNESDITYKYNSYQKYYERFLASENTFKEIDLTGFSDKMFIFIRDHKFPKIYTNSFILYNPHIPIQLPCGKPITMKYFSYTKILYLVNQSDVNNLTISKVI